MFPFERIIGCLQKTNTNHKSGQPLSVITSMLLPYLDPGELERMMLMTFCTAAKMKIMLQRPDAPDIVKKAHHILCSCTSMTEGVQSDIDIFHMVTEDKVNFQPGHDITVMKINAELKQALERIGVALQDNTEIKKYSRFSMAGKHYAARAVTRTDCNIFWEEGGHLVPGIIKSIFTV